MSMQIDNDWIHILHKGKDYPKKMIFCYKEMNL